MRAVLQKEKSNRTHYYKEQGISEQAQKEIAAIITHVAFYAGWPKGWAVFNLAKEVWDVNEGDLPYEDEA